jgi:hypothetical protein
MTVSQPSPPGPGALPGSGAPFQAQDAQHLDLLYILHYVLAAMAAAFACFPIFHVMVGLGMASGIGAGMGAPVGTQEDPILRGFGLLFAGFAGAMILTGWAFAILVAINGRFLSQRVHYRFCLVVSAVECFFTPFGTVLGILTLVVLARPTVKSVFDVAAPGPPSAPALAEAAPRDGDGQDAPVQ